MMEKGMNEVNEKVRRALHWEEEFNGRLYLFKLQYVNVNQVQEWSSLKNQHLGTELVTLANQKQALAQDMEDLEASKGHAKGKDVTSMHQRKDTQRDGVALTDVSRYSK